MLPEDTSLDLHKLPTRARSASNLQKVCLALEDSKPGGKGHSTPTRRSKPVGLLKMSMDGIHYSELYVVLESFIYNIHI